MRDLGAALVTHACDEAALAEVVATAAALATTLRATGVPRDREARIRELGRQDWGPDHLVPVLPERPVGGTAHPAAVPVVVHWDGSAVSAEVVIDAQFDGAAGRAHGGVVAGLFDDVLSHVVTTLGVPAVTGRLNIAYRAPTPTGVPVTFRGTVVRRNDRVIVVDGEARHGDTVTATAELTMVVVDPVRFARYEKRI